MHNMPERDLVHLLQQFIHDEIPEGLHNIFAEDFTKFSLEQLRERFGVPAGQFLPLYFLASLAMPSSTKIWFRG